MSKYSAEELSLAGDQFLGRKYTDMDCQTFVENAMRQVGLDMDLKGSNAWYREVMKNGWVGTPEECKKVFGGVPKGALLFIHVFDGGEVARGYKDGLGNAKHIGIKTGRSGADMVRRAAEAGVSHAEDWNFGDGAIHSSSTREHVATSKFKDETIKGGGWNTVGLYNKFTYGEKTDAILASLTGGGTPAEDPDEGEPTKEDETMYKAILKGGDPDFPINIRKTKDGALQEKLPQGSEVTVVSDAENWCKIQYAKAGRNYTGWVKSDFVQSVADADIPDEPDEPGENETVQITLSVTAEEALYAVPLLEKLADAIAAKYGRG